MYDCLIIGGGGIGLSLAYELSGHGLRLKVIDRGQPGREASWAGAGILPPANQSPQAPPYEQLRGLSHQLHVKWASALREETGIDNGYRRCGGLHLARNAAAAEALCGVMAALEQMKITVEELSPDAVAGLEPALGPLSGTGDVHAAYLLPEEAQIRNPRHLRALLAACLKRGVEVTGGVAAEDFEIRGDRIQAVHTGCGPLRAETVCICSGAWSNALLGRLGLKRPVVRPIRGQMVLFSCDRAPLGRVINEGLRYLVPRDDGRVLAGSTEEDVGFDCRTTGGGVAGLLEFALGLVPSLSAARLERTWAGLRPATVDGLPYLGPIPGVENALIATGHFRSGLHLSPGTAVVLGQLVRGENPDIDLAPLHLDRH